MPPVSKMDLASLYPRTWARLPKEARRELQRVCREPEDLPHLLGSLTEKHCLPGYLQEMAELEAAMQSCRDEAVEIAGNPAEICLNPTLSTLHLRWKGLLQLMSPDSDARSESPADEPSREETDALLWWDPCRGRVRLEQAQSGDLLALKMVAEEIEPRELADDQGLSPSRLYSLLQRARSKGLLLGPPSRMRRPPEVVPVDSPLEEKHGAAEIFTLQWHITDACDMHCRHCYSSGGKKKLVDRKHGYRILQEASRLCREKNVRGQITFTGGNPLLHPDFFPLYQAAVREGFVVAILGNPVDDRTLERLLSIEQPALFQVSLEGMREHNDFIRQEGHYDRVLGFLDSLRRYGITSRVMLTLTRANTDQVLPLAEVLRDSADSFTFNRISLVGEGASLSPPATESYMAFLEDYLEAVRENPVLRLKDNMLNPVLAAKGEEPFGGCTGFGCGAAFNFLALLPDGQVHACRKFPSPLGHIDSQSLDEIYDSPLASAYRSAPQACLGCSLSPVCRGCPAVVHSFGGDVFRDRDPYCPGVF